MKNLIIILFASNLALAQKSISVEKALQLATENSPKLKNEKLYTQYLEQLTKTARDLPNASFSSEIGQFNTTLFDVKLGVTQALKLPLFYKKQENFLKETAKIGNLNEQIAQKLIAKEIELTYNEMIFLNENKKILRQSDSIYTVLTSKLIQRFEKGEGNLLEKTVAPYHFYFDNIFTGL